MTECAHASIGVQAMSTLNYQLPKEESTLEENNYIMEAVNTLTDLWACPLGWWL